MVTQTTALNENLKHKSTEFLQQAFRELSEELHRRVDIDRHKRAESLVGRCFIYKNSFGSEEQWDLFIDCIRLDEDGEAIAVHMEEDSNGSVSLQERVFDPSPGMMCEVPRDTFEACVKPLKEKIMKLIGK
jgi:hypothetical protein